MLAVMKQIMEPAMNPRNATCVITRRFSGAIVLMVAIIMPSELGLANPQIAYVAMAELRNYCGNKNVQSMYFEKRLKTCEPYRNLLGFLQHAQPLVGNKLVDDGLARNHVGHVLAILPRYANQPGQRNEQLAEDQLEIHIRIANQEATVADQAVQESDECHEGNQIGRDAEHNIDGHRGAVGGGVQHRRIGTET